ncbi:sigma factor binding protein 2, chloroplastic [Abrus precatorius]|uniref:Sigma factor binding protein 2, chloroplastic n=1 Tax=Abrus precatorius TaxID=3816 RepID=A0A8B8LA08_ABRPR|nr:sigma factor binding protein 2, chloroplastic [Abrus precatorius]
MDTITNSLLRNTTTTTTTRSSVHQTTPTKKAKPKKKPIKVVYISNPMKIKTSASEFRALVQELTGQDAESPPDPSRFPAAGALQVDSDDSSFKNDENDHLKCVVPPPVDPTICEGQPSSIESFEPFDDDVFTPQMIENISGLFPASVFYESPHLGQW